MRTQGNKKDMNMNKVTKDNFKMINTKDKEKSQLMHSWY